MIHLEPEDPIFRKIKRSVTEDIKTEETVITNTEIIADNENGNRNKRTINNNSSDHKSSQGPNLNVKAGLQYHHQQRHPNGSVSGGYAMLDPKGSLQVMHYVSDDKGYREYPEVGEPGSQASAANHYFQFQPQQLPNQPATQPHIEVVSNGDVGNQAINPNQDNSLKSLNNRQEANLDGVGSPQTQILQSAVITVGQHGPKSPLYHKYHRPSPQEVQRSYQERLLKSGLDPSLFSPPEPSAISDVIRDKPMQVTGVFNQYQPPPYQVKYQDVTLPPPQELYAKQQPLDLYPNQPPFAPAVNQQLQQPYPENIPAQPPSHFQAFDQQAFPPGQDGQQAIPQLQDAFPPGQQGFAPGQQGLPPLALQPVVNQPYPANIPIYDAPAPPNVPTYIQPPPSSIPIYNQQYQIGPGPAPGLAPGPGPGPGPVPVPVFAQPPPNNIPIYYDPQQMPPGNVQNTYYASGSRPQPKTFVQNTFYASGPTPQPIAAKNR
ncbi:uncharacterized protein LOC135838671 isoform X2 [Planococcus citri]